MLVRNDGTPIITKDGVTVADELELADRAKNGVIKVLRAAASRTASGAGDGTTTSTVIAGQLVLDGLKLCSPERRWLFTPKAMNPVLMKRGIDLAAQELLSVLYTYKQEVENPEQVFRVATIACNNDVSLGKIISDCIRDVGPSGAILTESSPSEETYYKVVSGYQFDAGYMSPYFSTDPDTMRCVYTNPYLLVWADEISSIEDLKPLIDTVIFNEKRPLVLFASGFSQPVMQALVMNTVKAGIKICAVKAPGWGTKRDNIMQDLAMLAGTEVYGSTRGDQLKKLKLSNLGTLRDIQVGKDDTVVRNPPSAAIEEVVKATVSKLQTALETEQAEDKRKALAERIGKLTGGVGVIYVGAQTVTESKEILYRVDDAIHATRAAIETGILPGGGIALLRAAAIIRKNISSFQSSNTRVLSLPDVLCGFNLALKAAAAPFKAILHNAGYSEKDIRRLEKTLTEGSNATKFDGIDVLTNTTCDMIKQGIIDPFRVTREALLNAVSAAGTLLTTSVLIVEDGEQFGADQLK